MQPRTLSIDLNLANDDPSIPSPATSPEGSEEESKPSTLSPEANETSPITPNLSGTPGSEGVSESAEEHVPLTHHHLSIFSTSQGLVVLHIVHSHAHLAASNPEHEVSDNESEASNDENIPSPSHERPSSAFASILRAMLNAQENKTQVSEQEAKTPAQAPNSSDNGPFSGRGYRLGNFTEEGYQPSEASGEQDPQETDPLILQISNSAARAFERFTGKSFRLGAGYAMFSQPADVFATPAIEEHKNIQPVESPSPQAQAQSPQAQAQSPRTQATQTGQLFQTAPQTVQVPQAQAIPTAPAEDTTCCRCTLM